VTRLTPPPRLPRPSRGATRQPRVRDRAGGVPSWLALLLLAALGSGAFAVFALLPGWVERREPWTAPRGEGQGVEAEDLGTREPPLEADVPEARVPAPATPDPETPPEAPPEPSSRPSLHPAPPAGSGSRASAAPAVQAVQPVKDDGAFREAMSEGLAALDRKDWTAAREALERARSIRPDAPQISDTLARIETGEKVAALAVYRAQGREHEAAERWRRAEASYRAALALDPTVDFAREGLARATARAELAETLRYHLDHPERLSSLAVLDEVSTLVERAREIEPAGPDHRRQVAELSRRVTEWSRPVTARLVSDGQTRVTLYRVGRLGTFTHRELELRPGTYTAVGHREGYRDVRREWVIRPGRPPEPLQVICEEEIRGHG